jgi:16S rRNA (uracil1498-N3)-methyltransferase
VNAIVLAPARRSVVRLQGERLPRRVEHLREVAKAACCQCGRNRLVTVAAAADLDTALKSAVADGRRGVLLDPTSRSELADAFGGASYALAVGPEGGFDAAEVAAATRLGFHGMRLGPRVLRTETAALAAIATLQAAAGDFGALGMRR